MTIKNQILLEYKARIKILNSYARKKTMNINRNVLYL